MSTLREDARSIIDAALKSAQPDEAVRRALTGLTLPEGGRLVLVSIGKAGWQMAAAAARILGDRIFDGIVITKYGHARGALPHIRIREAGHPVPDENGFSATREAMELVKNLRAEDTVVLLISGGGSALFEAPLIPEAELTGLTKSLLASGADIVEMNTIRKRLSAVKGGRFGALCAPARVLSVVLSDIVGDPLDMIASGPAYPDGSTAAQAFAIAEKYGLALSDKARALLRQETPKTLANVETRVTGSVKQLCRAAEETCKALGYRPTVLTASLCCTARDAGSFLSSIAQYYAESETSLAFIAGGETVVKLTGDGLGGRNQELALAAAAGIAGLPGTAVFSLGSDGTDGPTDAAGGYCDGETLTRLRAQGVDIDAALARNDAYHALARADGLIMTGPTGTNVNDVSVLLIKRSLS